MRRLACVEVPTPRLQILFDRHPEWLEQPAAVLERDDPQATILEVSERARSRGVRPGLRYSEGLAIEPGLRAAAITPADFEQHCTFIARALSGFSPAVERAGENQATFWLDATGLVPLYPSLAEWAGAVRKKLAELRVRAAVAVGFTRFGTYVAARALTRRFALSPGTPHGSDLARARCGPGLAVFESAEEERKAAMLAPLELLDLPGELRVALGKLGIRTVGTFLRLPAPGLLERFGPEAHRLYRFAAGDLESPLQAPPPFEPIEGTAYLDPPASTALQLLATLRRLLPGLLERAAARHHAATAVHLMLALDDGEHSIETVRPARPTADASIFLELFELRLAGVYLPAPVTEVRVRLETRRCEREQLRLPALEGQRDLEAGARALARLRAEFGEGAVVRARLKEGHLPEARFVWEPVTTLERAHPRRIRVRPLVRRLFSHPLSLPPRPSSERIDNWLLECPELGRIQHTHGPYVIAGGWWNRPVHREYYFAETARGDILWLFYDRCRRRWRLHGRVE